MPEARERSGVKKKYEEEKKEHAFPIPSNDWPSRCHRLHYRWSQLQADRCGVNIGSPIYPLPPADRVLRLQRGLEYKSWPELPSESPAEKDQYSRCSWLYQSSDYHTFCKNGSLKLTEVEIYFLSRFMTRTSACQWALVYIGIGSGDRFRWLRDSLFPSLTVIGFDPVDENFEFCREHVEANSRRWNDDGTDFYLYVRCYADNDAAWIKDKLQGKQLLFISDIRGIAKVGKRFDKHADQDLQWKAIQDLRPVSSLVKFLVPEPEEQFYEYASGVLLKQTFCNYGTTELRLMIDGVPEGTQRYNAWEISYKMSAHHEHWRGQVYETTNCSDSTRCLDSCFDCSVLRTTISSYAEQNNMDSDQILREVLDIHVYAPSKMDDWDKSSEEWISLASKPDQQWSDVQWALRRGKLMVAIAALEADAQDGEDDVDWADISKSLSRFQPELSRRLWKSLPKPASRGDLIRELGLLSEPFTLLRTDLNGLYFCS